MANFEDDNSSDLGGLRQFFRNFTTAVPILTLGFQWTSVDYLCCIFHIMDENEVFV